MAELPRSREALSRARARVQLGTLVEIRVPAGTPDLALADGFEAIETVERLMSRHRAGSDIDRINRAGIGEPVAINPATARVLRLARRLGVLSGGLFDCAIEGRQGDLQIGRTLQVRKRRALTLDLGGIAKGEAVDAAVRALRRAGVRRGLVNAGGDLRVFGPGARTIELRHPLDPGRRAGAVLIERAALASSSACYADEPGRSTIIDPRVRRHLRMEAGVSVLARRCVLADALTKVVALSGDLAHPALVSFGAVAFRVSA
jgi:thiamine biosynthesis lipoprotein